MPLSDQQRIALVQLRAFVGSTSHFQLGIAESTDQRARVPDPAHLPDDVIVCVEIAPPSPHPHPLLNTSALKTPERVPLYFYTLRNDQINADVANTLVVFYIHGGGNLTGHPTDQQFIPLFSQILRAASSHPHGNASRFVIIAPSYRLATVPKNTFPAQLQDLVAAYDYVISKGYNASNIVLAGDSAGGNHAVVLAHLTLQSNTSPRGIVTFAPDVVHILDGPRERAEAQASTDILSIPILEAVWGIYVGDSGVAWTDPLVSGAFLPFSLSQWPKTLILVGSADLIYDASHELKKQLSALNLAVELVEYDERPHGWWNMSHIFLDDIMDAAERVARFVIETP